MKQKKSLLLILAICFIIAGYGCLYGEVKTMKISKEKAVEVANKELINQNIDVAQKNVIADENNTIWNERYLNDDKFKKSNPHVINQLKDRKYWALYYMPKETENLLGGESWVFVDKYTGEVILFFSLK